jgi:Homoserine dehydrogenase
MDAVDVPVALLGYGTVGEAVHRLLTESGDEIERATGHRFRVVRALVRDPRPAAQLSGRRRRAHHRFRGDTRRPVDRARRGG